MNSQIHDNSTVTSLSQDGTQLFKENPIQVEQTSPEIHEVGCSNKNHGQNFSSDEDKILVSSWLNTSLDPVIGTNTKWDTFWKRIENDYNQEKKKVWPQRSVGSLSHRWSNIQQAVNKFCGFLSQVESQQRSGVSEEDNVQEARRMFHTLTKQPFGYDHCWVLLKDQPKWNQRSKQTSSKRKSLVPSSPSTPESTYLGEDQSEQGTFVDLERPRRKVANERMSQGKSFLDDVSQLSSVLFELKDEKKKAHEEKMEKLNSATEQRAKLLQIQQAQLLEAQKGNRIKNEKLQLERMRQETDIMMKDISIMDPDQREYFQLLRMEILEKRRQNSQMVLDQREYFRLLRMEILEKRRKNS